MGTVRRKLLAVVALCILPTVVAMVVRAREVEGDLMDEASGRLGLADEAFNGDLEEDLSGMQLALRLAGSDPRLIRDLSTGNDADTRRLVAAIANGAKDELIAVVDEQGRVIAVGGAGSRKDLEGADLAPLYPAWEGRSIATLLPLKLGKADAAYSLFVAEPVADDSRVVGAILMGKPLDADYLDHARRQLGSHWAIRVNGELVAESRFHPAPELFVSNEKVLIQREAGGRYVALYSFRPAALQREGYVTVVTAAVDVTRVRREVYRDLLRNLAGLALVMLLATGFALRMGKRIVRAIAQLLEVAQSLGQGRYQQAEGVKTGDELEALAVAFNQAVAGLKERDQLKETFGKYVTRQVADHILMGQTALGGETVPVTVFFADIRGFTALSERMHPKALLDFLNIYFSGMVTCVMRHSGVVDKFIGDAIMAVFGAPVPHPDDALRAVRAALDMREKLKELNATFVAEGRPEVKIGIGMHSGTVVAGNMGHADRMEYTVIGDPVNLASRLEGMTKDLGVDILMSEDTYRKVAEFVTAEPLQPIRVRGRAQEVMVYTVLGLKEPAVKAA